MSSPGDPRAGSPAGPLAGLRVLDWTHALAGPLAAGQLALLGADVVRIEPVSGPEIVRDKALDPTLAAAGLGESFIAQSSGKRSLAVNAHDPRVRHALAALIARADVLVENFRPGKLAALGFDPAELVQRHPQLVVCSITGYAAHSPEAGRRAYDHVMQAASGLMAANADDEGTPRRIGFPLVDCAVGQQAALAVLAALHRRQADGLAGRARQRGEWLRVSMMGAALSLMAPLYAAPLVSGREAPRSRATAFSGSPLSGTFATRTLPLALVCNTAEQGRCLFEALAAEGVDATRLSALRAADAGGDVALAQALLGALLRDGDAAHWEAVFVHHDVPAAAVRSAGAAAQRAAADWPRVALPLSGQVRELRVPGLGFHSSEALTPPLRPPPRRGEHTRELLAEAGVPAAEIDALVRDGCAHQSP